MKKKIGSFILIGTVLSLGLGTVLFSPKKAVVESQGYSASSLPTTIDLNDTSASNIRSYYSSLNNLSTSERQGTNLLKNLKTILKNGQKYYSYENGTSIWQMYEITDRDWDKSPASSTTYGTYNSNTNKITNYTYGTSSSSSKNNPYIHALYINRDVNNQTTAWDNHNQDQWGINREHVWPKAEGFDSSGAGGARGDPMHLMAGNGYANNIHSNYYYGYVKTSASYTDCGSKYSNQSGNLRGTSKTLNSGTVFEPQDCDKGDIARAIFYMVARYNYLSGSDSDGIDMNNPNLTLTQNISDWSQNGYTSSTSTQGKLGILTDLLAWHHADPVDAYEVHRNNLLYTNFTNNRNPFIDFPEWADFIWGRATYSGSTYQSYSSTPTGYAKPSSDTINGYNSGGATVSVTSVSLNKASTSIEVGGAETLEASVAPTNATNQGVSWSSSNTSIATVSNGVVRGVAEGSATITVTTSDGGYTATCSVTITAASQSSGEGTDDGSVTASSGGLSGWTASGTGSAYADGTVKFGDSGVYVYKTDIFSGIVSTGMTSLTVTINGKINGTATSSNSYKVEALDSSGSVLASDIKTGSDVFASSSYADVVFTLSNNLSGCTGLRITYVTKGGGNWGVKKVSWIATYSEETLEPTSIIASVNKTFSVGETITKSDVTLKDDLGNTINDFTFSNYMFTYEDTLGGGNTTYEKDFDIEYGGMETSLSVDVSRKPYSAPESQSITLVSSSVFNEIGGSNSNLLSGTVTKEEITYKYYKAYYYSGGASLSFGNASSQTGYLQNQTAFNAGITDVTVTSTGRAVNIRYSVDGSTWVLKSNANTTSNNYLYFKVDCIDNTGTNYSNITQISITLKGLETPTNLANYIMYEDTTNQCATKFNVAKGYFEDLTKAQRVSFMTSDDYVISNAKTRFEAWARSLGKTIISSNGDYVISNAQFNVLDLRGTGDIDYPIVIMVSLLVIGTGFIIGCYLLKRRKEEK